MVDEGGLGWFGQADASRARAGSLCRARAGSLSTRAGSESLSARARTRASFDRTEAAIPGHVLNREDGEGKAGEGPQEACRLCGHDSDPSLVQTEQRNVTRL